jgi:hypothetical protein
MHEIWKINQKKFADKSESERALTAAIMLLSTRGDVYLTNRDGEELPCSTLTVEGIFDALVDLHDTKLMAHTR